VTGTRSIHSDPGEDVEEMMAMSGRLAEIDPPALRSLAGELKRPVGRKLGFGRCEAGSSGAGESTSGRTAFRRRAGGARLS
jgi:hypothetical protein